MNFYAYRTTKPLEMEYCGSSAKVIWRDLKTLRGALSRLRKLGWAQWSLYTFTNFYDDSTFTLVHRQD